MAGESKRSRIVGHEVNPPTQRSAVFKRNIGMPSPCGRRLYMRSPKGGPDVTISGTAVVTDDEEVKIADSDEAARV